MTPLTQGRVIDVARDYGRAVHDAQEAASLIRNPVHRMAALAEDTPSITTWCWRELARGRYIAQILYSTPDTSDPFVGILIHPRDGEDFPEAFMYSLCSGPLHTAQALREVLAAIDSDTIDDTH